MARLKAIKPKATTPGKSKIVIFGKSGVGKTWSALDFPDVYYIDTEGGANLPHYIDKLEKSNGVYLGIDQGSSSLENIIEQVEALATEKHEFKTLVIDSLSKVFNNEIAEEAKRLGNDNFFGADKKPAIALVRELVRWLQRIDMNVVIICHEKTQWGKDNKGNPCEIGVTFDCWDKLTYELDLCLNVSKIGKKRISRITKSRLLEFPENTVFPWAYKEFAERYGRDLIESEVHSLELATDEQLTEFDKLCREQNITDELKVKWLKRADVSLFNDMDKDKIGKIIEMLNKRGKL